MKFFKYFVYLSAFLIVTSCQHNKIYQFLPDNQFIRYEGRIDFADKTAPVLIGSASFLEARFSGDSCVVMLQKNNPKGEYNYVSVEIDGEYQGRIRLEKEGMQPYVMTLDKKKRNHILRVYKSTEAANNSISFGGINCHSLLQAKAAPKRKIEFIGNSITCGMGIDWKEVPCDSNVWYDQHNAYFAYGPRVAKDLNASFMLSSVSGIGVYRNWNSLSPVMPDVYENMYLNTDSTKKWNFESYSPDLVSICLGTNDLSSGDGIKERLPFDSVQYVNAYINFIETVVSHYPDAQLCLLSSPMIKGERAVIFESCLKKVKQHFDDEGNLKKEIALYFFEGMEPHGCSFHPDREDHRIMADKLEPFYKKVMGW